MSFPGFTNQFTNSPISITFPDLLTLEITDASTQLFWGFVAPYETNLFAQTIRVATNSSSANALSLPDASLTSNGQSSALINNADTDFNLLDFDGNTIGTIASGNWYYLTLTNNTNEAGSWLLLQFGTTPGVVDVSSLVDSTGVDSHSRSLAGGLAAILDAGTDPGTYLKSNIRVFTNAAGTPYTQDFGDRGTLQVWTGGSSTYTLKTAASVGNGFIFSINNATANSEITFITQGSDTIDVPSMTPSTSASFISDGISKWTSLGLGLNTIPNNFSNVTVSLAAGSVGSPPLNFVAEPGMGIFRKTGALSSLQIIQSTVPIISFQADSTTFPNGLVNVGATVFQQQGISVYSLMRAYS